ncbi:MAG: high frequency lysogenization protein HflD [Gammaproteobacteria bacterium]|nr:high frequency lysogenization protein HflD [Gammaproteobacteria bacterium]MCP5135601.1 high frequency lysogenization protein HflD [Gammaproteobacteria bacterium]
MHTLEHRTLALAGIYQAASLVDQIARRGDTVESEMATLIGSVFRQESESVVAIYAGDNLPAHVALQRGLRTMLEAISTGKHREITRYAMTLVQLEGKLGKHVSLLDRIGSGISDSADQVRYFGMTHENVLARLADLYVNTISTLSPRINVFGEPVHLENVRNKNAIRALLLAGMRSAVLWRQCGGSRWRLLFERRALINTATAMLGHA